MKDLTTMSNHLTLNITTSDSDSSPPAAIPNTGTAVRPDLSGLRQKKAQAMITIVNYDILTGNSSDSPTSFMSTNKFLLTGLQRQSIEKSQVLETFGEPAIFFFDERVRTYILTGEILDSLGSDAAGNDYNWSNNLQAFYNNYLRGSILAKNGNIAMLTVLDHEIYGYPLSLNIASSSYKPNISSFSMNFLVIKHKFDYRKVQLYNLEEILDILDIPEARKKYERSLEQVYSAISQKKNLKSDCQSLKESLARLEVLEEKRSQIINKVATRANQGEDITNTILGQISNDINQWVDNGLTSNIRKHKSNVILGLPCDKHV